MYCWKCGTQCSDTAAFCANCGAAQQGEPAPAPTPIHTPDPAPAPAPQSTGDKNRTVTVIAAAAVAIVAILALTFVYATGGFGPAFSPEETTEPTTTPVDDPGAESLEAAMNQFMTAVLDADTDALMDLLPAGYEEYLLDEYYEDRQEMVADLQDTLQWYHEDWDEDFGRGWEATYRFKSMEAMSEEELEDEREWFEEYMGLTDVSACVQVEFEITFTGGAGADPDSTTGADTMTDTMNCWLAESDGIWYWLND